MNATEDLIATAIQARHFAVLLQAIDAAGLTQVLALEGPYTLFAPRDAAFESQAAGVIEEWFADPQQELIPLLLYHIVPGRLRVGDLFDGLKVETTEGGALTFGADGGVVRVNGVPIINGDMEATNGVIHVIADVLTLPIGPWDREDQSREVFA